MLRMVPDWRMLSGEKRGTVKLIGRQFLMERGRDAKPHDFNATFFSKD
jgi:hypothetical protein